MTDKHKQKADIVAVAKAANVSISTVSRSFNHPDLVRPRTRKKIDAAVRRLGYIRNRAAQTMHGIRSGTIGLVVPTIDHTIFAEVIQAFSDAVDTHGFTILVASHGYDLEREYAVLRKFLEHRVDGVALIGLDHSEETYHLIESQEVPAISIWNYQQTSRIPCVGADNFAAGALIARHVLEMNHRDIAIVFPPTSDNDRARERLRGVEDTLAQAGIDVPTNRRIVTKYDLSSAKQEVAGMFGSGPAPTAIICGNDVLAFGAIYAARQHGLHVPRDMSIVGIGDFKGSRDAEPGLTTIRIPARQIGHIAGEELARAIIESRTLEIRFNCDLELMSRNTCARTG